MRFAVHQLPLHRAAFKNCQWGNSLAVQWLGLDTFTAEVWAGPGTNIPQASWCDQKKFLIKIMFCCCSVTQSCPTLCNPMDTSMSGFPVLHRLPELAQTHVRWVGNEIRWTISSSVDPFSCLQIFPSLWVFSYESALWIRWPKYLSFSFSISPSNEYSGLISFRTDWFDLLAV